MKILFCGPLRDFSGFAHASRNFLLTLLEGENDVTARALRYDQLDTGQETVLCDEIKGALTADIDNVEMAIQMTTPNEAVPVPGVCNGLYTFIEADRIQVAWVHNINRFDFVMVACKENAKALSRSGVTKPVLVVPPPCNVTDFNRQYPKFEIPNSENRTVFYNVCQLSAKKGVDSLLRAYYAAFADMPNDVLLVLKTYISMSGRDQHQELDTVKQFIDRVKQGCRIPTQLPPVWPIVRTLSDDDVHGLHLAGDCYVCSSRGEGWGIPVFDAMGHGKAVISNNFGGLEGFVSDNTALVYGGSLTPCYDMHHPDPFLYTGLERWFEPSVAEMSDLMRSYHLLRKGSIDGNLNEHNREQWISVQTRQANASMLASKFDYREVADKVNRQLDSAFEAWSLTGEVQFDATAATVGVGE
jgi:glycosyltransferase involved in cell wall biosynthesis